MEMEQARCLIEGERCIEAVLAVIPFPESSRHEESPRSCLAAVMVKAPTATDKQALRRLEACLTRNSGSGNIRASPSSIGLRCLPPDDRWPSLIAAVQMIFNKPNGSPLTLREWREEIKSFLLEIKAGVEFLADATTV